MMAPRLFVLLVMVGCSLMPSDALGTPQIAAMVGESCDACHQNVEGGGALNPTGAAYRSGGVWPPVTPFVPLSSITSSLIRLLHLIFGFLWFGTILYVHLLLRPAYAAKGLPIGEMRLGIVSMVIVGISGALLTLAESGDLTTLPDSHWGAMLTAKIAVYLTMVISAAFVVTWIKPRLKSYPTSPRRPADGIYDPTTLAAFDGKKGRPAYVALEGAVYDATDSHLWKEGTHMKRHFAGYDLTGALGQAPHGKEKVTELPRVGDFDPDRPAPLTTAQRLFYAIAYMNLGLVFVTLAILAFW